MTAGNPALLHEDAPHQPSSSRHLQPAVACRPQKVKPYNGFWKVDFWVCSPAEISESHGARRVGDLELVERQTWYASSIEDLDSHLELYSVYLLEGEGRSTAVCPVEISGWELLQSSK